MAIMAGVGGAVLLGIWSMGRDLKEYLLIRQQPKNPWDQEPPSVG